MSIRSKIGDNFVLCLVNSDINSAIIAQILDRALGPQARFLFIDTELVSANEEERVTRLFKEIMHLDVVKIRTNGLFLNNLMIAPSHEAKTAAILNTFTDILCDFMQDADLPFCCIADGTFFTSAYHEKSKEYVSYVNALKNLDMLILQPLRNLSRDQVLELAKTLQLPVSVMETNWTPIYGVIGAVNEPIDKKRVELYTQIQDLYGKEMHKNKISVFNTRCVATFFTKPKTAKNILDQKYSVALKALDLTKADDKKKPAYLNFPNHFWIGLSKAIRAEIPEIEEVLLDLAF